MSMEYYELEVVSIPEGGMLTDSSFNRCVIIVSSECRVELCTFDNCDIIDRDGLPLKLPSLGGAEFTLSQSIDRAAYDLLAPQVKSAGAKMYAYHGEHA